MAQSTILTDLLATSLPKGSQFIVHHVSTPPASCPAIFAAPPQQKPDETFRESHFLSISTTSPQDQSQLQVFALEVFIYTTKTLTTLFVSKADSTGYLYLLNLAPGTPSPLKTIATVFLQYLIDQRTRIGTRLVLSLFARAQNQYLFPGSIENSHKHVLDDRGLIKWWCRVADPLLKEDKTNGLSNGAKAEGQEPQRRALAYLRVPGYDTRETRNFFPRVSDRQDAISDRWKVADPLVELASADLPERCLIPRFPDDPKARFLDTLDEELPDDDNPPSQSLSQESLERVNNGRWRSIKSLEQFWEAMSYRQECSSGRLVGFLWAVFTPSTSQELEQPSNDNLSEPGPSSAENGHLESVGDTSDSGRPEASKLREAEPEVLKVSEAYHWPLTGRGEVVVPQTDYDEIEELLTSLDYANQSIAAESTLNWTQHVGKRAGIETWGKKIIGEKSFTPTAQTAAIASSTTNVLSAGLVRKKKRPIATVVAETGLDKGEDQTASLKKQKVDALEPVFTVSASPAVET